MKLIVSMLILLSSALSASAQAISSGLIARYDLDGNASDLSGNLNHATPAGNHTFIAAGRNGGALRVHGDGALFYSGGGHLILPQFGAGLNQGLSVSLWVKDESIGTNPVGEEQYVSFGSVELPQIGISLDRNNASSPRVIFFLDPIGTPTHPGIVFFQESIADFSAYASNWKHLVLVYEPGRFAAFLNGRKLGEANATFSGFPVSTAALNRHWWSFGGASSARMSATYDDVLIYNRALSDAEVMQLYSGVDPCSDRVAELEAEIALLRLENSQLRQELADSQSTVASLQATTTLIALSLSLLEADYRREFGDPLFEVPSTTLAGKVDRLIQALLLQNRGHKQALYKELKR